MSNYTKATNFATKDTLPTGNAGKIIKGTELDDEFNAISSAISSKADTASPAFTGTPTSTTASSGTSTTQIATTAFVQDAVTTGLAGTATNATNLVTTNFSIKEVGGKLYFYYGTTQIASMDSSGNFIVKANVTAYGTP